MVRWLIQWLHWCAFAIAATAGKTATATQFVATDATRHVQRHCRPERSREMQACEYGGLLVLLRLEEQGRRQGEPLRARERREQVQRHGGLLSMATATECGKVATAPPSAPPSTATPSAPLTPAPTLSTAVTAATRLLHRFCSLLLPSPAVTSSTAVSTVAAVQRRRPVQLWSRRLLSANWWGGRGRRLQSKMDRYQRANRHIDNCRGRQRVCGALHGQRGVPGVLLQ